MTGATNILTLEGLETADVVQALERHSSRHGIPAVIFVNNGTQLKTLSQAKFSLESANKQVQESMGMRILESNPKSHKVLRKNESSGFRGFILTIWILMVKEYLLT